MKRAGFVVVVAACVAVVACTAGTVTSSSFDAGAGAEGGTDASSKADSGACSVSSGSCVCISGGGTVGGAHPGCPPGVIECNTDNDCKTIDGAAPPSAMVCSLAEACPGAAESGECIDACQVTNNCLPDEQCATSGHCVPKTCNGDGDCPAFEGADYACTASTCAPKTCTTDTDCAGHYCINSACYDKPGACALLAP